MRDGVDYLPTVAYDKQSLVTCPVWAVEQYTRIYPNWIISEVGRGKR